jgi:hypothetical protein
MTSSRSTVAAACAAAMGLAACGGADGEWQGSVTDSAGVEIVSNTGDGMWDPDEGWTVRQELVIGTAEGEAEYQFGQIAGIDVGSDGRLYVLDQQAREVRVYSPEGEFIATMGQAGAGPGELSQAAGPLFVGPGDTVRVPDALQPRITRYTPAGEPAGSYPLPMADGIPVRWMEAPDQDLVQQSMIMQLPNQQEVEPKNLILRRGPSGEVEDTLLELPIGETVNLAGDQPSIRLFEPEPVWAIGLEGQVFYGNNSEYSVNVRSPEGDLTRIIRKPGERRPITDSDAAELRRIIEGLWADQGLPPQAMEMMSQALSFADHYPAYANIMGGPEGTLWVQGVQTPDELASQGQTFDIQDLGSATWEVFDAQGRLLGTVSMPGRFTPLAFIDDAFYGVLRDELDVQYAARMSLDRGVSPLGD